MDYLREYFKKDLVEGYSKKFDTDILKNQIITTTINKDVYSIQVTDTMIAVYAYDKKYANLYLFNSEDPNVIFTHYKFQAENARLLNIQSTVYRYEDDHSIISSRAIIAQTEGNDCVNKIVFFAENYVNPSPIKTFINIECNGKAKIIDFADYPDQVIDDKNPYYAISRLEGNLKYSLNKVRGK